MNNRNQHWRLILHPPYGGAWNMAVDEALLESVSGKAQPPTLRIYDWQPYTLSLGHAQQVSDVNIDELKSNGWDLVRRPTGGKAILHADELTYSLTASLDNPIVYGNVIESYRKISLALVEALTMIGLPTDSKLKNSAESHLSKDPVCFQFPSDYEITFHGKKIIGSAQARKKNGILQHGSIPLHGDINRIVDILEFPDHFSKQSAKTKLINRATTVETALGNTISWTVLADAVVNGFRTELGVEFSIGKLSLEELERARILYKEKYNHHDWTFRI